MENIRNFLELFSLLASIVLAIVGLWGLRQLTLFKEDIRLRNERASKEKAIEYSLRYLTNYVELNNKFYTECENKKLQLYNGPIGVFSKDSIPPQMREMALKKFSLFTWLPCMNELLAIASAFTTGVADEQTGFLIIGRSFCISIQSHYDIISFPRDNRANDYYQNIVNLYLVWSPRLSKAELEDQKEKIETQILKHSISKIPPIGME
jgi:hypothetical protein